jgi:hypothetical protein
VLETNAYGEFALADRATIENGFSALVETLGYYVFAL